MMLRIRELAAAAAELDAAIDWYSRTGRHLAVQFFEAVEASIARIREWSDSGRPYPGREGRTPALRTKRVKSFPYSIVYLVDGADLAIFACLATR